MNLLNKLTIKNLKLNKKRTIVTIIGIILSVALITAVASMYSSGIKSLINFETYQKGNFHVAYYDVPVDDLYIFKNHRDIETINLTMDIGYAKVASKNEDKPYAFIKAFTDSSLENLSVKLVEGRLPKNDHEILIPTHLKTNGRLELKLNSEITLDVGKRIHTEDKFELDQSNPFLKTEDIIDTTSKTYKIVGIIERPATNIESYDAPGYTFITHLDEDEITGKVDVYARFKKSSLKNVYGITANILGVDETLYAKYMKGDNITDEEMEKYINEYSSKERYNVSINNYLIGLETDPLGLSSVGELGIVVAIVMFIIIFTSVFCIKNSFDISITEKIKQYGMLRSIGATKKQIRRNVFYEATILGMIGIPLGILSGILAAYILIIVCNYFLAESIAIDESLIFSLSYFAIIVAVLLGIITIYLSSLRSARRAAKVSPIDSIRNSANIKINSKKVKSPKFIKKIFGMGGDISYKNLKRNKKKYRTTVISIAVSVFVFIALSSFMNMAFEAVESELNTSDYNISLASRGTLNERLYDKYLSTTKLDGIEDYTVLRETGLERTEPRINSEYKEFLHIDRTTDDTFEYVNIYALGEEQYKKYIAELGLNHDDVYDKGIMMDYVRVGYQESGKKMVYKTLRYTDFKVGEVMKGTSEVMDDLKIELACITDKAPFGLKNYQGTYIVVSDKMFDDIIKSKIAHRVDVYYKAKDANKLQDEIDEILKGENYSVNNIQENVDVMNNLYTLVGIFLYGFIIVISLIGITNVFNTITTNMELRKQEFAMLKSIGMTSKEFTKMIRLESFFMGMKSLAFGIPIGLFLSYLIYYFLGRDSGMGYHLPILALVIAITCVFLLISLIMKYSMSKINKQNTIETIRNENI